MAGTAVPVDVAVVNDQRFVNNASVGLYPFMVRRRDDARERTGLPKWLATLPAAWAALSRLPHHRLRIDMGEGAEWPPAVDHHTAVRRQQPLCAGGRIGRHPRDSERRAAVDIRGGPPHPDRADLVRACRTLFGRADRKADFVAIGESPTLDVRSTGRSIEKALDGEVRRLKSPLKFTVDAGALKIVMPGTR